MEQVHKRFTAKQVKGLLKWYRQGPLDRPAVEETLAISRARFFALLKQYRLDPDEFSLCLSGRDTNWAACLGGEGN